eukprot:TRINITY_DN13556_c0_g1_i2.p1 TRINITY_DN13556_c0_g1~~TRINITY_DN13556_c0_g1_i2.p1  ORF type:complete len:546 (-),score=69.24 TRINITY_DN13556_c0_g1_i2:142-1779(-)
MSWEHSQSEEPTSAHVALLHRLANAMLAEVVVIPGPEGGEPRGAPTLVAVDARVEYCKPKLVFLEGGRLLMRLNALLDSDGSASTPQSLQHWQASGPRRGNDAKFAKAQPARHGLWIIEDLAKPQVSPVNVLPEEKHGSYDVCSGSYNHPGAAEGFVIDRHRSTVVLTVRRFRQNGSISYSDDLLLVKFGVKGEAHTIEVLYSAAISGKGCKIPIALSASALVYHHRSPTESGDLWIANLSDSKPTPGRLTKTMPLSLQKMLLTPKEVTVKVSEALDFHAFLFAPEGEQKLQPLLWLHGGPMASYSFDFNPLLSWLASCGYLVMVPNFSGSTGSGLEFMDRVLADGCGVADLRDCLACAEYLKTEAGKNEPRLDLSRGVAVGGHSWGGYLAFMCMLQNQGGQSVFSCGVATAGITDWFTQQRYTEVRYYDYALMGGWVYEPEVATRARKVSPISMAGELRAPILILHGEKDIDVPFQQIPPFVEACKRSSHPGASVEYHAFAGEGHGMAGTQTQADYLDKVKTFLRINLKPWDFTDNPHGDLTSY